MPRLLHFGLHVRRDLDFNDLLAVVALKTVGLILKQAHDAFHIRLEADRQLYRHGIRRQAVNDRLETFLEARAHAIEFVDKTNARHIVLVGVAPIRFGLRLDTGNSIEDNDGAVQNTERPFYLDREIDMSRSVDKVDLMFERFFVIAVGWRPERRRRGRSDRDATFALLFHPIHHRVARVYFADLMRNAGIKKHPF